MKCAWSLFDEFFDKDQYIYISLIKIIEYINRQSFNAND